MSEKSAKADERAAAAVADTLRSARSRATGVLDSVVGRTAAATGWSEKTIRTGLLVGAGFLVGLLLSRRSRR